MNRLTLLGLGAIAAAGIGTKIAISQSVPASTNQPPPTQPQNAPLDPGKSPGSSGSPPAVTGSDGDSYASTPVSAQAATPNLPSVVISTCNGNPGDANVRSAPGGVILGYVPGGSAIYLTGRVSGSWHEVMAPGAIADPGQQIPQTVWVADCFVR